MNRVQNILFVVISALVFFAVIGAMACSNLTQCFRLPSESLLEDRAYEQFPNLTPSNLAHHRFQNDFEQFVADRVPARDDVLLANAAVQRRIIELANIPFSFEVYHANFGSSFCCWPSQGRMLGQPDKASDELMELPSRIFEGYANLASDHSEINWLFYLADRAASCASAPTFEYVNNACDLSMYADRLRGYLPSNCALIVGTCESREDLLNDYMATDHHWNVRGAAKCYKAVVTHFGFEPTDFSYYEAFDGPCFGSAARMGRCADYPEPMLDVEYDRSPVSVVIDGREVDESFLDKGYAENGENLITSEQKRFDSYASWFHRITPFFAIKNDSIENGSLLVVCDSFGNNMQRFFAEHYRTVYVIDPRYYEGSIDEFIAGHDIDDAVFIVSTVSLFEESTLDSL